MMYLKFILGQIKLLLLIILSAIFVYPVFVYPNRKRLWVMRNEDGKKPWYFYFADTYETLFGSDEKNYLNSTYGIYELVKDHDGNPHYFRFFGFSGFRKFILAYRWAVIRNGMWNYIIYKSPKDTEKENIKRITNTGGHNIWTWRNKEKHGKQHVTWYQEGKKYFRYSFTKKFIFGKHINFMLGTGGSNNRNLIKLRIFKY